MSSKMRQVDKIKEKVEIRLDTNEIAWLVVGCLLTAGGVFVTGYYVGASSRPAPPRELASVLETEEPSLASELPAEEKYTYDKELTTETPLQKLNDPWLEVIAENKDKIEDSIHNVDGPDLALAGPRPVEDDAPPIGNAKAPAPAKAWPQANGGLQPEPGTKADSPPSSAGQQDQGYTIQIKAFQKQRDAKSFANALKNVGYKPYIVTADIPGKGRYFRVRLGKYVSMAQATTKQATFEKAESYSTIVTPL